MAEPISIKCPHCSASFKIKSKSAFGKKVKCPKCDSAFVIQKPPSDKPTHPKKKSTKVMKEDDFFEDETNSSTDMFDDAWEDDLSGGPAVKPSAKKKKKPPKKKKKSQSDFSLQKYGLTPFITVSSIGLILLNLVLFFMQSHFLMLAFMLTFIVAIGCVFAGGLGLLIEAAKESGTELILCLIVPLYNVYFAISRFEQTKQSLATFATGALLLLISFTLTFGSASGILPSRRPSFTPPPAANFSQNSQPSSRSFNNRSNQSINNSQPRTPKSIPSQSSSQASSTAKKTNQTQLTKFDLSQIKPMLMSWPVEGTSGFNVYSEKKTASIGNVYETMNARNYEGEAPAGGHMKFRVYLPPNLDPASPVPCILVPPAGSNLLTGMEIDPPDLIPNPEHEPYVNAGFAVVTFSLDGDLWRRENASMLELKIAHEAFKKSKAGLVNCLHAFLETQAVIPGIDKNNIFIAGHSSAGTLSLLFAEHYPQVKGCVAYAPSVDLKKSMAEHLPTFKRIIPDIEDFIRLSSPQSHISNLKCPVFLFHSRGDQVTSFVNSQNFASQLKMQGTEVEFVAGNGNDHYQTMIDEGLPKGIEWIKKQVTKSNPSQSDPQMAAVPSSMKENKSTNEINLTRHRVTFKVNGFDDFYKNALKSNPEFWKKSLLESAQFALRDNVQGYLKGSEELDLVKMTFSFEFVGSLPQDMAQKFADDFFGKKITLAHQPLSIKEVTNDLTTKIMESNFLAFRIVTLNRATFNRNASPKIAEANLRQIDRYVPDSLIINYKKEWVYIKLKGLGDKLKVQISAQAAFSKAGILVTQHKINFSPADLAIIGTSNPASTTSGTMNPNDSATKNPQSNKILKYVIHYGVYSGKSIKESVKRSLKGFGWVDQKSIQFNPDTKEISFVNKSPVDSGALERALTRNKFYQLNITQEEVLEAKPSSTKEKPKVESE